MLSHNTVKPGNGKNQIGPDECPVCGQEYAKVVVIERGTHWKDLYQGTVFDYITRYRRRCTASINVEANEDRQQLSRDKKALYFHDDKKKQARA